MQEIHKRVASGFFAMGRVLRSEFVMYCEEILTGRSLARKVRIGQLDSCDKKAN
jgi:hypothetical protein